MNHRIKLGKRNRPHIVINTCSTISPKTSPQNTCVPQENAPPVSVASDFHCTFQSRKRIPQRALECLAQELVRIRTTSAYEHVLSCLALPLLRVLLRLLRLLQLHVLVQRFCCATVRSSEAPASSSLEPPFARRRAVGLRKGAAALTFLSHGRAFNLFTLPYSCSVPSTNVFSGFATST